MEELNMWYESDALLCCIDCEVSDDACEGYCEAVFSNEEDMFGDRVGGYDQRSAIDMFGETIK